MSHLTLQKGDAPGVALIDLAVQTDARGWSGEVYNEAAFSALGLTERFGQDNHAHTKAAGTLRGLHYQMRPHGQARLVRCVRGAIWHVAVDVREGASFGAVDARLLSGDRPQALFLPAGYANGYLTLEDGCDLTWKVSAPFVAGARVGLAWDDPALELEWPTPHGATPFLADADRALPRLAELAASGRFG